MMMTNMISPTTILSPATKLANDDTTCPAASNPSLPPRVRISRVVATFSTNRARVVANSKEGKTLNSSGVRT